MVKRLVRVAAMIGVAGLLACGGGGDGGGGTGPSATYASIAGNYAGVLAGNAQGIALNATFSLTITQAQGSLGGSYAIQGALTDGVSTVPIQGTGTLSGSIASGGNPSVSLTVTPGPCPNRAATFTGTFDTANRRLTISGPVYIFDSSCTVQITYQSLIVLAA